LGALRIWGRLHYIHSLEAYLPGQDDPPDPLELANWGLSIYGVGYIIFTALKPTYPDRMILLILWNLANWGLSMTQSMG
jgi:hypothetical protein